MGKIGFVSILVMGLVGSEKLTWEDQVRLKKTMSCTPLFAKLECSWVVHSLVGLGSVGGETRESKINHLKNTKTSLNFIIKYIHTYVAMNVIFVDFII